MPFTIFCGAMILGGAIIIGLSILQTRRIFKQVDERRYRRLWQFLTLLMGSFVIGYLIAFYLLLHPHLEPLLLLLATVFGLGAVFVFLTVYVSRLTIDHLHQLKETLRQESLHDPLTGLANRRLFNERLEHCIARYGRLQDVSDGPIRCAVIMLDLDNFKLINDNLGHGAGDQLLIEVGRRLKKCLREGDTLSRLGGDEFCLILENLKSDAQSLAIAERIQKSFEQRFDLNQQVYISCSLGISALSPHRTATEILQQADLALYQAKSQGKKRYASFTPEMQAANLYRFSIEKLPSSTVRDGN